MHARLHPPVLTGRSFRWRCFDEWQVSRPCVFRRRIMDGTRPSAVCAARCALRRAWVRRALFFFQLATHTVVIRMRCAPPSAPSTANTVLGTQRPDVSASAPPCSYRLALQEGARDKAASYIGCGYDGTMFPWESAASGNESCPQSAPTGQFEQHISGDVSILFVCVLVCLQA